MMIFALRRALWSLLLSVMLVLQLWSHSAMAQPAPPLIQDPNQFPIQLTHLEPETPPLAQTDEITKNDDVSRVNQAKPSPKASTLKDLPFDPYRNYYESYKQYESEVYGQRG